VDRVQSLAIVVPPEADVHDLRIAIDGVVLDRSELSSEVLLERGKPHEITVSAPGYIARSDELAADSSTFGVLPLDAVAPEADRDRAAVASRTAPPRPAHADPSAGLERSPAWLTAAVVVGGAGVVGLGIGTVYGGIGRAKKDEADCDAVGCANQRELQQARDARTIADISSIAGVSLLAGAAVIYFAAPAASASPRATAKLDVGPGHGMIRLQGRW
jgi:hypothetical protein